MTSAKKNTLWAELGLMLATIFWGSAFAVMKTATESMAPACIIAIRYGIGALPLLAVFSKRLKKWDRPCLFGGLLLGALNFAGMELQTVGLQYTTAGKNAFLTSAYCVAVPFLYWIVRRKKPEAVNLISALLCVVGIGLLSLQGSLTVGFGDLLSLLCGLAFAAQIVAVSILTEKHDPILLLVWQTVFTMVFALPFAFHAGFPATLSAASAGALLYLGIFCTMAASAAQIIGQKYTTPAQASLTMSLESVFGTLSGIIFLKESVTPQLSAGFALIFTAVLLSVLPPVPRRKTARHKKAPEPCAEHGHGR